MDRLELAAGIGHEIDRLVPAPERHVGVGEAVQAMVLYLAPEFFANKPVDLLIRPGITGEMLNDDRSRGDALHRPDFGFHGACAEHPEEEGGIRIPYGYSQDHRPDLKQVVVGLLTTYSARSRAFQSSNDV